MNFAIACLAASLAWSVPVPLGNLKRLFSDLHRANELEMQLGRLAARRGASASVRRYGDRLERDHRLADGRLLKLARRHRVLIEELAPEPDQELDIQRLRALNGPDFDRLFAQTMEREHRRQNERLSAAVALTGGDVRRLLSEFGPVQREHETLAKYLEGRERGAHAL